VESAAVLNPAEAAWRELKPEEILIGGARVRTAVESRAEIHPYPNFYIFLGSNTEIVYSEKEDRQVSVTVVRGSVIIVSQADSKKREQNSLTLIAENTESEILARGHFRLNLTEGKSEMLVYDGSLRVAGNAVKAGKRFVRDSTTEAILPLDKSALDGLVVWSNRRMLLSELGVVRRLLGLAGGLWLLDESTGEYTFVPAIWDYSSPYGGRYLVQYPNPREYY
jgi:ferric-dicitrate binding protein FerR (iron transport regulator)